MQVDSTAAQRTASDPIAASVAFSKGADFLLNRDVPPAINWFDTAQRLGYETTECAAARWDCWMLLGQFQKAWMESDLIDAAGARSQDQLWDGRPWAGKSVMLRCLHGLGDTIQFIRYAPLLKETCSYLSVQAHPQLVSLLNGVNGVDHVFTWCQQSDVLEAAWEVQMEVTELPRAFRSSSSNVPSATPYIHIPDELIQWGATHCQSTKHLRVGLTWEAGPWDPQRSIPLSEMSSLFASACCSFFGLQKRRPDTKPLACSNICDIEVNAKDVRDTAALILNLDLVITVDTMTAHLAGALGRPVWILLPSRADWRWMLNRDDSPWYPTARLFRQKRQGDWAGVIEEVSVALAAISH